MKLALSDESEEESKYEFAQKNRNDNDGLFQEMEIARLKKELEKAN